MADLLDASPEQAAPMIVDRLRVVKADAAVDTDRVLAQLGELLGGAPAVPALDRFMSWDEVREMAADGVTFGAHGETHRILTRLSDVEVRREAEVSKARIATELLTDVAAFSYPNGNWNQPVAEAIKAARYRLAFSMDRSAVSAGDDRFSVRRVNIHEDVSASVPMFLARVLGVF